MRLRPSSFPMWTDCYRRGAAKLWGQHVEANGFALRSLPSTIGASIGTATHAAAAHVMLEKIATGSLPASDDAAEQAGMEALDERIQAEGVEWDRTSPNRNTAQKQVRRQYRTFRIHRAEDLFPQECERRIELDTRRGNVLSGQPDIVDMGVWDLKTGVLRRVNLAQLGGYSLLLRSEGRDVQHLTEDFVQRVPIDHEQPPPSPVSYNVQLAERVAANVILDMETKFEAFQENGDQFVFPANPASNLCSERWCPAWGTNFCEEGKR